MRIYIYNLKNSIEIERMSDEIRIGLFHAF